MVFVLQANAVLVSKADQQRFCETVNQRKVNVRGKPLFIYNLMIDRSRLIGGLVRVRMLMK